MDQRQAAARSMQQRLLLISYGMSPHQRHRQTLQYGSTNTQPVSTPAAAAAPTPAAVSTNNVAATPAFSFVFTNKLYLYHLKRKKEKLTSR